MAVFLWKKGIYNMKEKTKHEIRQAIETIAIGIICSVFVLSLNQSCSNMVNKWTNNKKIETKKVQELKNKTIQNIKFGQRVR